MFNIHPHDASTVDKWVKEFQGFSIIERNNICICTPLKITFCYFLLNDTRKSFLYCLFQVFMLYRFIFISFLYPKTVKNNVLLFFGKNQTKLNTGFYDVYHIHPVWNSWPTLHLCYIQDNCLNWFHLKFQVSSSKTFMVFYYLKL